MKMDYVRKQCPFCGNEFIVRADVANKELFCTLGCLSKIEQVKEKCI